MRGDTGQNKKKRTREMTERKDVIRQKGETMRQDERKDKARGKERQMDKRQDEKRPDKKRKLRDETKLNKMRMKQ